MNDQPSGEAMEIAAEERQDDALRNHLARRIDAALAAKQAEIDDQQKEIEGAEKTGRELNRLIDAKQAEIDRILRCANSQQDTIDRLTAQVSEIRTDHQEKRSKLIAEIDSLTVELKGARCAWGEDNKRLQAEIDQLQSEVSAKQGYIERMESVNDKAASEIEMERSLKKEAWTENKDLRAQLESARTILLPLVQLANGWTSRLDKLKDASAIYDEGEGRTYYAGQLRAARTFLASLPVVELDPIKGPGRVSFQVPYWPTLEEEKK